MLPYNATDMLNTMSRAYGRSERHRTAGYLSHGAQSRPRTEHLRQRLTAAYLRYRSLL